MNDISNAILFNDNGFDLIKEQRISYNRLVNDKMDLSRREFVLDKSIKKKICPWLKHYLLYNVYSLKKELLWKKIHLYKEQ